MNGTWRRTLLAALVLVVVLVSSTAGAQRAPRAPGRIVFISNRSGNPEVWIMNRSGSNPTQLTNTSDFESGPKLSPGGEQIVYARTPPGSGATRVWVMNSDGSNQHEVTAPAPPHPPIPTGILERDRSPAWSPDGTQIVFVREGFNIDTGILVMNADGTNPSVVAPNPQPQRLGDVTWSPDGTKLAFSYDLIGPAGDYISILNLDGSGTFELTAPPPNPPHNPFLVGTFDRQPAWSPDATQIAFVGVLAVGAPAGVWIINADGSNPVQLTQDADGSPSWSPEGNRIVFSRGGNIWTMKPDGTLQVLIGEGTQPHWAPK